MSKPQRRKGNAKNASSSAAHMYLSAGGASFVGLTPEVNIFEIATSSTSASQIDDEARIVLKKLVKKDASTREKGLRELMVFLDSNEEVIEPCYQNFYGMVDKLATDGSSTVRLLTQKVINFFINKLQKSAGKGLKKIMPIVLFQLSDASNSVCAASENVLLSNFGSDEKRRQAFEIFGPATIELAIELAQGQSELCLAEKYDNEEDVEQRKYRLEVQALNSLQKLSNVFEGEKLNLWVGPVEKMLNNGVFVKKTLNSKKNNLKAALLSLCTKLPNPTEIILNSPMNQWILNSIDSDVEMICDGSWNVFIQLLSDEEYYKKVPLMSTIMSRVLNAIRKKKSHWSKMGPHILPAFVSINQHAEKHESNEHVHITESIISSFISDLPFDSSLPPNCAQQWAEALVEIIKWTLTYQQLEKNVKRQIISAIVKSCEESTKINDVEIIKKITGLIHWILEKKVLNETEMTILCQLVEVEIIGNKEKYELFCEHLLSSQRVEQFSFLHSTLLNTIKPTSMFFTIRLLLKTNNEYFRKVVTGIRDSTFLIPFSQWSGENSILVAEFVEKIIEEGLDEKFRFEISNDQTSRELLAKSRNLKIWKRLFENVKISTIQEMIDTWKTENNGEKVANLTDLLREKGIEIKTNLESNNIDFVIDLLKSSKNISLKEKQELTEKAFKLIFNISSNDLLLTMDHFKVLAESIEDDFEIEGFFENLLRTSENLDIQKIEELAKRFENLMKFRNDEKLAQKFLINEKDLRKLVKEFEFIDAEILADTDDVILPVSEDDYSQGSEDETEVWSRLKGVGRWTIFNWSFDAKRKETQICAAIFKKIVELTRRRFVFTAHSEELEVMIAKIGEIDEVEQSEEKKSAILMRVEQKVNIGIEKTEMDDILKKYIESEPEEFLKFVKTISEEETGDLEIFQINENQNSKSLIINFLVAKSIEKVAGEKLLKSENREFIDFLLCGIVTAFDSLNDLAIRNPAIFEKNLKIQAFAKHFLKSFANVASFVKSSNEITPIIDEWNEFYQPTIERIVLGWVGMVKMESQPTPFIRSLYEGLEKMKQLPEDVENVQFANNFEPELDALNYSPSRQSLILHAFEIIDSNVKHVQLIGLKLAKLIIPSMFEKENMKVLRKSEETKEESTTPCPENETKIGIPVILRKKLNDMMDSGRWTVLLLFDLCLMPFELECLQTSTEHRVAYCDALVPVVKYCLTALILKQPIHIPRSIERDYFLVDEQNLSEKYFDRYSARLLFRTLSAIPAIVRLWFKSLPTNATSLVKETITKCASRLIIEKEMEKVKSSKYSSGGDGELKIRAIPVAGEIVAEYVVDETKMKLTICLPPDFPLTVPSLSLDKAIVKSDRAKKWLLQLNAYLFHQNGATIDGIEMWRKNVDRGVEGAEACTICMMTIHSSSHQLPRVKCKQCKNKFHSNCLYKWFETSNQASCPLCRANFT